MMIKREISVVIMVLDKLKDEDFHTSAVIDLIKYKSISSPSIILGRFITN